MNVEMDSQLRGGRRRRELGRSRWLVSALLSVAWAGVAAAQEPVADNEDASASGDIVVTAQKRSENIQDVPIAITAFSSDMLEQRGVSNPQDLQHGVPGLVFSDSPTGVGLVTVRGVGGAASRGSTPGRNPAVPVHANGVYLQSPAVMMQDFLDIERVEVLRGPQGTLYGRNAVGGSINVITKRPTRDLEGEVGFEIGNYDQRRVYGIVSGPLSDRLRARLAFAMEDRDGYVKNVVDPGDDKLVNSNYSNVRATVEYDLTDNVMVTVVGYYYDQNGSGHTTRPRSLPPVDFTLPSMYNLVPPGYEPASFSNSRRVQHDTRGDGFDRTKGITGEISWDLGGVSLRSVTGYFNMRTGSTYDADGIDLPQVHSEGLFDSKYKSFSQELQLASDSGGPLKWLLGAYYYNERSSARILIDASTAFVPYVVDFLDPSRVKSRSAAIFGQVDYEVTDALTLTGGLRYTHDKMDVVRSGAFYLAGAPLFAYSDVPANDGWKRATWKLGANYQFSRDIMAYLSYSRGYKSGGFNLQDTGAAFRPEILDAYEAGFKTDLIDRMLRLNGSLFYYDYKDKQEIRADITGFSVFENAGAATLYGAELEMLARITSNLSVDTSFSYLHSRYDRYNTADPENPAAGVQDLAGNNLTEAPKWQVHMGGQYDLPLGAGNGKISARVDYAFTDGKYVRAFNLPTDRLDSYSRTSARIWWESDNSRWHAELFVDNIENKDVVNSFSETSPFAGNFHIDTYLPPRTYGFKLSHRF